MKFTISEPQLRGKIGYQKTNKEYHLRSHASGGCKIEEDYIQKTNGQLNGYKWITDDNTYDIKDFWLCNPNGTFAITYHTFGQYACSHYYKANSIDGLIIELGFLGQWGRIDWDSTEGCLYKIGDEKIKSGFNWAPVKWWNFLFKF